MVRTLQSELLGHELEAMEERRKKKELLDFMDLKINNNLKKILTSIVWGGNYYKDGQKCLTILLDNNIITFDYLISELTNAYDISVPKNSDEYKALKIFFECTLQIIFRYFISYITAEHIQKLCSVLDSFQQQYVKKIIEERIIQFNPNEIEKILDIIRKEKFDYQRLDEDFRNDKIDDIINNSQRFQTLFSEKIVDETKCLSPEVDQDDTREAFLERLYSSRDTIRKQQKQIEEIDQRNNELSRVLSKF